MVSHLPKFHLLCAASIFAYLAAAPVSSEELAVQIQLKEYEGHEAYFALYLTDPDGRYHRTLWLSGPEEKYHKDIARWWRYAGRSDESFDAITGASTAGGGRVVVRSELSDDEVEGGYGLVVETSVEDQRNVPEDAIIAIAADTKGTKVEGKDYVRFIRYKW